MKKTNLPCNRKIAIEKGESMYFTGKPCKNGHIAARYTESCGCRECVIGRVKLERQHIREIRRRATNNMAG